jgi:hypothetical protein
MVQRATLMSRSVRIAEDEARWLTAAADNDGASQNDLIRPGLHRLRGELGAANRKKRDATMAAAKPSRYKLASPRAAAGNAPAAAKMTSPATASEQTASASAITRAAGKRARES